VQPTTPVQPLPKQVQPTPQPGTPGTSPAVTFQRRVPQPPAPGAQPQPGRPGVAAAPPAPVVINVQQLKEQRHERVEAGGRVVIEEPDHRFIERDRGQVFIRHDENERLLRFEEGRVDRRRDGVYTVFVRPDGDEVITVTDDDGRLLRRFRRDRFGREIILIDNRPPVGGIFLSLAPPVIRIPQEQYIVDTAVAPEPLIYDTLVAPPLVPIERPYSLDEIRYNVALRDRMRRIDVDTLTFDTGSWAVGPDQVTRLQFIAQAIRDVIARNPNEVFLVEGHTDAVGGDEDNLSLSDRRAESVADILTETFQIPPENLTTQGYGAHFLKIQTPEANRQNRRVTVRRITPLLAGQNG
jgi:outer membrane protein OmpA-like peptidoglycan-associated protein